MGYHRAGFDEIVGVDNRSQPRYPFDFVKADALEYVAEHGHEYDAIHASPPCQGYSIMRNLPWLKDKEYPLLIDPVRELLEQTGKSWVIENVMGAHLPAGWLCGAMFGMPIYRHRYFETSWFWMQPGHPKHQGVIQSGRKLGNQGNDMVVGLDDPKRRGIKGGTSWPQHAGANWKQAAVVMNIDWMKREELTQAIPPAYTEYIGHALMRHLGFGT
jgi:DNA (cytosine-5)-methyltransferase 1